MKCEIIWIIYIHPPVIPLYFILVLEAIHNCILPSFPSSFDSRLETIVLRNDCQLLSYMTYSVFMEFWFSFSFHPVFLTMVHTNTHVRAVIRTWDVCDARQWHSRSAIAAFYPSQSPKWVVRVFQINFYSSLCSRGWLFTQE